MMRIPLHILLPVLLMSVLPYRVAAQDISTQENRKARIEKEIAIIDRQLKDNAAKSSSALSSLTLIRKKVADRRTLVAESDREIAELNGQIAKRQKAAGRMQRQVDTLSFYYAKLIRNAYKNRDSKIWYMYIFASESIGQAFRRATYLKNLSSEMNRQGKRIIEAKELLQNELDSLEILRGKAGKLREQRASEMNALQKEEAEAESIVKQLQRNRTKYQNELAAKKRQVDALNREIQRLIASAGKSGKAKSGTAVDMKLDAEFANNKGRLPWPVDGPVVDHFGQHYHPVFKSVKLPFNNGMTVATEKDAAVHCVFDGVVKQIVVMPGYNKCILVQHGGYFSFYCKIGTVAVKPGDKVKTGDIIGTIDTIDGMNQLHFQIWKGTKPQNPETWLR